MEIKNINEIEKYNIVCTNTNEVQECKEILEKLGLKTDFDNKKQYIIIRFSKIMECFSDYSDITIGLENISFYDFKKQAKKFIPVVQDIEYNEEDGRITKINNNDSDKNIYSIGRKYYYQINYQQKEFLQDLIDMGSAFISEEARDKARNKLIIENKLRNIASRLNNGKIDWNDARQKKYYIYCCFTDKELDYAYFTLLKEQGTIYCLSDKFLDEAIKNIGEDNLIKYFKE